MQQQLEDDIVRWVEEQAGGSLCELERHVARREAWLTSVRSADGSLAEGFLRVERNPREGSTVSLAREAAICAALQDTDVPVPAVYAWDPDRHLALFERVPGSAAIDKHEDASIQRAVMEDFIDAVARLHQLRPGNLDLEKALGSFELSARECALADVESQLRQFAGFLQHYRDPLMLYGIQWLRRFAPGQVHRVCLVQGDTGPVNFMFEGDRVTALVDWEWGHWGDPMEDLGNICVREFWNPSGGLRGLFERYAKRSGIPYEPRAVRYYRVQQNVRGMIPIHAACQSRGMRESMAWYMAYRYVGDRSTCEALADAMGVAIERPPMPEEDRELSPLADAALGSLRRDLVPELQSTFASSRATDVGILLECMARRQRYAAELEAIEAAEIADLLGQPVTGFAASVDRLCQAIEDQRLADEPLLRYLARRAYRDEWLHAPVSDLYPDRRWSALD